MAENTNPARPPLTAEERAALKARAEKATSGPWCFEGIGEKENIYAVGVGWKVDDDSMAQLSGKIEAYSEDGKLAVYTERVCFVEGHTRSTDGDVHSNAAYLAAADPTTILRLLDDWPTWRPIAAAAKNKTPIWAALRGDIYPALHPNRPDLETLNGLQLPLRHIGVAADGFDIGWSVAAPVGLGGIPDEWIAGWLPLPPGPPHG